MSKIILRYITMKKKFFIIILLILSFIILSIILFKQIANLKTTKENLLIQAQKVVASQNSTSENNSISNTVIENTTASQLSTEDIRKNEIEDKINRFGKNENGIPVLMYHFFYDSSAGQKGIDNNYLEISKFEEHLKYLKENEFFFPTFAELADFIDDKIDLPKKSIILTIDDGNITFFALAVPIIEKYEIPVTSFVITSKCDSNTIAQYQSDYVHFESHSYDLHQARKKWKRSFS